MTPIASSGAQIQIRGQVCWILEPGALVIVPVILRQPQEGGARSSGILQAAEEMHDESDIQRCHSWISLCKQGVCACVCLNGWRRGVGETLQSMFSCFAIMFPLITGRDSRCRLCVRRTRCPGAGLKCSICQQNVCFAQMTQ